MQIRAFHEDDTEAVVELWRAAGLTRPWNDPHRDIARKLTVQPEMFLVATEPLAEGERVVGAVMAGFEGHRGWINYLAALPEARGLGIGRALVERVEAELLARGCPKVSLQVRSENEQAVEFYRHLGYQQDPVLSFGKRLIAD